MPELPELEAHAERLTADFGGAVLDRFLPMSVSALKTFAPAPDAAYGHGLQHVGRRGKYLLMGFDDTTFVVHLMQGGRLRPDEKQARKPRGGLCRWTFADGRALLLTEAGTEKRAGVWVVDGPTDPQPPLDGLGPDADGLDVGTLTDLLRQHRMRLHGFLRDQKIVAGIGRRLANEICHRALISPFATTANLDGAEIEQVAAAVHDCIAESLEFERARDDMSSAKDRPSSVHHRTGEPCPRCDDGVRAVEYRHYTVNYCPTCQTEGKTLADNTTSKFLK